MVFYRKYRPQTIDELDSAAVRTTLTAVLSSDSLPHAFLFTGPKGLGKTSTARILAKAINCEGKGSRVQGRVSGTRKLNAKPSTLNPVIEPCNKCEQCTSITNGSSLDVLEIDAASNRGIDEIRDLRDKVRLAPVSARYKVYIIDEVHMLTTEAFNALLKTLEEPPAHVIFILCTTEQHKIPPTIFSRCFHVQFAPATEEELKRSFTRILKGEGVTVADDALTMIAALSDSGFRDGAKILEEVILLAQGKPITASLVEETYHTKSIETHVTAMLDFLMAKNTKDAIALVANMVSAGIEIRQFLLSLLTHVHTMLLVATGVVKEQPTLPRMNLADIATLAGLLQKAHEELRFSVLPQLPLELAIAQWGEQALKNADQNAEKRREIPQKNLTYKPATIPDKIAKPAAINTTGDFWQSFIENVKAKNHTIAGVLRGCALEQQVNDSLVIATKFAFHKDKLQEPKTRALLEDVALAMTGNSVKVSVLLKE